MKTTTWAAILFFPVLATNARATQSDTVFVERFDRKAADRWSIVSTLDPPQLRLHREGEAPGLHFRSVAVEKYIKSRGYAWAQWNVETRPFKLSWDIALTRALEQRWFYPGVAVAMTSAPPGEMGEDDIALTIGVHMSGIAAAVRKGGFYDLYTEGRSAYSNFRDKVLSDLINKSGGGTASIDWPMKHPGGSVLTFEIERTAEDKVRFVVHWPELPGDRGRPYYTGEWQMPKAVAKIPLRYISVKRMPVLQSHISYSGFVMEGVVRNIQGRLLDAAPAPLATSFTQNEPVLTAGSTLTVHGQSFCPGARVMIGGRVAENVQVVSPQKLICTLPKLPLQESHSLRVINPNGLFGVLEGRVPLGRLVEQIRPREALPEGGDVVTLVGGGFERDTVVTFGDKAAEVIDVVDPTRLRVRIPAGKTGRVEVAARTGDELFSGRPLFGYAPHPYLFYTADDLPRLRSKLQEPMFRHYSKRALAAAGERLNKEPDVEFNASVDATVTLSLAYAFTGQNCYRDKLMEWVRHGWLATRFDDFHLMSLAGMSLAYDVLFSGLTPEEKAKFQDYLDRALDGYFKFSDAWFLGAGGANFSNTVPVGNSGGMLAGLSLIYSTPRAGQAVDAAAAKAKLYPDRCISADGGCREGVQYWDYGMSFHLILAHALKNVTGDDRGLLDHPHLQSNVNFVRTTLGGHGGMFAFNDTRQPWLGGYAVCADLGSRYHQPLMLWVADLCAAGGEKTRARDTWAPFAFLWRSNEPSPQEFPGVPTLAWLKDMHWGAMRSDGTFTPRLVVGVKGSRGPLTHHKQQDLGSYVVHANGEAYLVDPGYYEPKPTDHTLPLIDGRGPGVSGSRITEAWEKGPWRHMTVDSTDGYGDAAKSVRRLIVMHGEDCVAVLDDILPVDGNAVTITAQYQTAWMPKIDNAADHQLIVPGLKGSLGLRCFGHMVELEARDRQFKSGWRWDKISEDGPGDWHSVTGTYIADPDRPCITVLQPARANRGLPPGPMCRYGNGTVDLRFESGVRIHFTRNEKGWQCVQP